MVKSNHRACVNAEIFRDHINIVFFPYLAWLRGLTRSAEEGLVLGMFQCSTHVTDDVICSLTEATVRVMAFAPQITQIFQVLYLTLFGVLERLPKYEPPFENQEAIVQFIMKVYADFKETIVPRNVLEASPTLKLNFDTRRESSRF
jgi:hypothetical protein